MILSARVHYGTCADSPTVVLGLSTPSGNLIRAGSRAEIEEVAADRGGDNVWGRRPPQQWTRLARPS